MTELFSCHIYLYSLPMFFILIYIYSHHHFPYLINTRQHNNRHFKLRGCHHQIRATRGYQYTSIRQHSMTADDHLRTQGHHREARRVVNQGCANSLLGEVFRELLAGQVREGFTADHIYARRGGISLCAGGGDEVTNDVGVGVGEDDISVVNVVTAVFENEFAGHLDIVFQFVFHGFFDCLVFRNYDGSICKLIVE